MFLFTFIRTTTDNGLKSHRHTHGYTDTRSSERGKKSIKNSEQRMKIRIGVEKVWGKPLKISMEARSRERERKKRKKYFWMSHVNVI